MTAARYVFTSSRNGGSTNDEGLPNDKCKFNFAKIEFQYRAQKADGSLDGPITANYDLKKKYDKTPSFYNANYYNAVWVTGKAMASLEKKGQPITGESIRNELLAIKTFDAVGGKMEFQPDGTVSMPMQINELTGGATKVLY